MAKYKTFYSVQALRAIAAIIVCIQHSSLMIREKLGHEIFVLYSGASGVDLFFCISGFVMILMLPKYEGMTESWKVFIKNRILRIVPIYWFLTTLKLILLLLLPHLAMNSQLSVWNTFGSYFFFPAWHGDEFALPIIQVGWTLNFEMFFYVLFAFTLALKKRPLIWLSAIMITLGLIGFFRTTDWGALSGFLRPLLFEFVAGMWIAQIFLAGYKFSNLMATMGIIFSIVILLLSNFLPPETAEGNWRIIWWGIPSAFILFSALSLEDTIRDKIKGVWAFLGNASYSIYLIQGFVMAFCAVLFRKIEVIPPFMELIICVSVIVVAGSILHIAFEKPITSLLKKYIKL